MVLECPETGAIVTGPALATSGDDGDRWAVYNATHVSMMERMAEGERSASVRLWRGEKVIT